VLTVRLTEHAIPHRTLKMLLRYQNCTVVYTLIGLFIDVTSLLVLLVVL